MMKKYILSLCVSLLGLAGLHAQQPIPVHIEPLTVNPRLAQENFNKPKTLFPAGSKYYFYDDTLSLPFIDDFSKDRFKDFRLSQYTGIFTDQLHYFSTRGYTSQYPDSVWYLFNKPDSFVITTPDTFSVVPSNAPQFTIYIYDTLSNPYAVSDSLPVWAFIPRMKDVIAGVPVYDTDFEPDGKLYNREKEYTIVPASPNDQSLWVDRNVYVSDGMAVKPPTVGVAVFDGINMDGLPYTTTPPLHGVADYLTSKPLNLSGYLPGDSLYLSFYVQPEGIGFAPAAKDSFVLEFKAPGNPAWKWAWSSKGSTRKAFRHIRIPIKDAQWLVKGFQFRFKNYADLNANMDHWLLDYVRLDRGRNYNDTLINDFAFVTRPPSLLTNYEQMPARQFKQSEVDQKWEMQTANLWNTCKWATYGHTTFDEAGNVLTSYPQDDTPGPWDTACVNTYYPGEVYNNQPRHYLPTFGYVFDVQDPNCCPYQDSIRFTIRHVLQNLTGGPGAGTLTYDVNTGNDTLIRQQTFYNFYAYDDGEAEACLYLGTAGQMAYEFELNYPDTLRAIQFYFSPQNPNISNNSFDLRVWKTLVNTPEQDTLYSQSDVKPIYNNTGPNRYTTYILTRPVVLPAGKFYVGWRQNTAFKINIGFDRNVNHWEKLYYKTTGEWLNLQDVAGYEGSPMIRPVLGKAVTPDEFLGVETETPEVWTVNVFPNPSSGLFQYDLGTQEQPADLEIQVLDLSGKTVHQQKGTFDRSLDLNRLSDGIYFARFVSRSRSLVSVHKLILSK